MQQIFLVIAESEFGENMQVVSVYFDKAKAESEAKEIESSSDMIAYVEEKDISDS